jgi:hypothetical protein
VDRDPQKGSRDDRVAIDRCNKKLGLLSIFLVPGDYRLNEPARKIPLLGPARGDRRRNTSVLGYIEPVKIEGMAEDERHAMLDECVSTMTICPPTDMLLPKNLFKLRRPR